METKGFQPLRETAVGALFLLPARILVAI